MMMMARKRGRPVSVGDRPVIRDVLRAFRPGDALDMHEIMQRSGRRKVAYRAVEQLVQEGRLVVVGQEPTERRPKTLYGLPGTPYREHVPAPF